VDVGPLVIADAQAAKLAQPRERPLYDPAPPTQATLVRGAAHGQPGYDVTRSETLPNPCGVIAAIPEHAVRMPPRPPTFAVEWGNRIDPSQRVFGVVPVGAGQAEGKRNSVPVANQMTLGPKLGPIGRIRTGLISCIHCETEQLSTTARDQSIW
jgi:hypothetical protein